MNPDSRAPTFVQQGTGTQTVAEVLASIPTDPHTQAEIDQMLREWKTSQ